ncbi:MAG TPA: 3-carboxy-cis,cis-muconate cycloisomerase [Acidobacteriaceae bacterium]|jgi:3-carboxy-cis,cis-muconate cycloisomerase
MLFQPPQSGKALAVFSAEHELQCLLDVEAALARAEARCGIVPASAAETIVAHCQAGLFEPASLAAASTRSGNIAIPLVRQLTRKVAASDPAAAGFVHWGATSQDIIDTGLILQLRAFLELMEATLGELSQTLAGLIEKHAATIMAGRTWMQQAVPITFGLKLAGSLDASLRHRERLRELRPRVLALQFGGAAGTLASLGKNGLDVASVLAVDLGLSAAAPWHTQRDRIVEAGSFCALVMTTAGKLARDLSLLAQTEVCEAAEPEAEGTGGSSTMPHKRNPVALASILTTATRIPGLLATLHTAASTQEHERGLGGWPAEWTVLPEICVATHSALETLGYVLDGLKVNPDAMRRNLDASGGLLLAEAVSMALAEVLGKSEAHEIIQQLAKRAVETGVSFEAVLSRDPRIQRHLSTETLKQLLEPGNYLGSAHAILQRVLAAYRAQEGR